MEDKNAGSIKVTSITLNGNVVDEKDIKKLIQLNAKYSLGLDLREESLEYEIEDMKALMNRLTLKDSRQGF